MDEQTAIALITQVKTHYTENGQTREALDKAVKALEKQITKKPIIERWEPARCPSCDELLSEHLGDGYYKHWYGKYICDCGQKLNWD